MLECKARECKWKTIVRKYLCACAPVVGRDSAVHIYRATTLVQNTLARVVTGTCRCDHILPVLADLHWLPIRARIKYKIATLVFKILKVKQPMFLTKNYKSAHELRSTSWLLLKEPCVKTTTGLRSFHFAAAKT